MDRSQGHARGRFIEAHEISHKVIPWHEAVFRLDDEERLFGHTKKRVDLEADMGAAELLFQGDLFVRRALDFEVSISAPIGLASEFDASMAASIRHYAAYHPDPVAVIVAGHFAWSNGAVPVWGSDESPSFAARFGSAKGFYPCGVPASELSADPAGPILDEALKFSDVARASCHDRPARRVPRVRHGSLPQRSNAPRDVRREACEPGPRPTIRVTAGWWVSPRLPGAPLLAKAQ